MDERLPRGDLYSIATHLSIKQITPRQHHFPNTILEHNKLFSSGEAKFKLPVRNIAQCDRQRQREFTVQKGRRPPIPGIAPIRGGCLCVCDSHGFFLLLERTTRFFSNRNGKVWKLATSLFFKLSHEFTQKN